jgi:hypothetical protein
VETEGFNNTFGEACLREAERAIGVFCGVD